MTTLYASELDLADRLGIGESDSRIATLRQTVEGASRQIDQWTGRRFYATPTTTRYYSARWNYPRGGESFGLFGDYPWGNPERPFGGGLPAQHVAIDDFISVSALATDDDGDGVYETDWTVASDYWLGPKNATADGKPYRSVNRNQVTGRYSFPPWENGISVTGTAGYSATVPEPIRELCMWLSMQFAQPVLEMSVPGVQSYQLGTDLKVTMQSGDLPPAMQAILEQYRDPIFSS